MPINNEILEHIVLLNVCYSVLGCFLQPGGSHGCQNYDLGLCIPGVSQTDPSLSSVSQGSRSGEFLPKLAL